MFAHSLLSGPGSRRARIGVLALVLALIMAAALPAAAQGQRPEPVRVELAAADDLVLVGTLYPAARSGVQVPAVLLLHMNGRQKEDWIDLARSLQDAGYTALAVDMRGHGETGGAADWPQAEDDIQRWIDWLRTQPALLPQQISVVGGSIGSNMALRAMANDDAIVTAVALSPGLDYFGVTTTDAVQTIGARPLFLVAGQNDDTSAQAVKALTAEAAGDLLVRIYPHGGHGTSIFLFEDDLGADIIGWLDQHTQHGQAASADG